MKLIIVMAALASFAKSDDKIIGGEMMKPGDVPYIANLRQFNSQYCDASVLSDMWLVSAAHCYTQASRITVTVGDFDLSEVETYEQTLIPAECIAHPSYNPDTMKNDIMMIKMMTPIKLDQYVQPVVLPSNSSDVASVGTECTVCGWGSLNTTPPFDYADKLYCVDGIHVISKDVCNSRTSYHRNVLSGMICIGDMDGEKDACQGDSGGPALCGGKLHGIVSWGFSCAQPGFPGVYTEVADFLDWINSNLESN